MLLYPVIYNRIFDIAVGVNFYKDFIRIHLNNPFSLPREDCTNNMAYNTYLDTVNFFQRS